MIFPLASSPQFNPQQISTCCILVEWVFGFGGFGGDDDDDDDDCGGDCFGGLSGGCDIIVFMFMFAFVYVLV